MTNRYFVGVLKNGLWIIAIVVLSVFVWSVSDVRADAAGSGVGGGIGSSPGATGPGGTGLGGLDADGAPGAATPGVGGDVPGRTGRDALPQGDRDMDLPDADIANPDLDRAAVPELDRNREADANHDLMGERDINRNRNAANLGTDQDMGLGAGRDLSTDQDLGDVNKREDAGVDRDLDVNRDRDINRQDRAFDQQQDPGIEDMDEERDLGESPESTTGPETEERRGFFDWLFDRE